MDRQAILKNFVTATRGKGRATRGKGQARDLGQCSYFPEGHPGCAIGCQPGFREQFETLMEDSEPIQDWFDASSTSSSKDISAKLRAFFEVDAEDEAGDVGFLSDLQALHDQSTWLEGYLRQKDLDDFCSEHNLAEVMA